MPKLVAIDIGSDQIKVVVGKAGKKSLTVNRLISARTPSDAVNNGEILEISLIREALTSIVLNNKLKGQIAAVTLQTGAYVSREFTIPKLKDSEVESALRFEVEQFVPINIEEYVMSCRKLESAKDKNGTPGVKYMVGLMPRRIVTSYHDLVKSAGLKPAVMDVNSNAIEKLISMGDAQLREKVLLLVDIGNDAINMMVYENGLPMANRIIPIGSSEITRGIVSLFGVDFEQAEEMKIEKANLLASHNAGSDEESICRIAESVVNDWVEQIRRMNEFYISRTQGKSVDFIYIYGGGSELKGLERYMENTLLLPVKIMGIPESVKLKESLSAPSHRFLHAIGALIRR